MDWATYSREFRIHAHKERLGLKYTEKCLSYALALYDKNLPIIYDGKHFSYLVGFDIEYIYGAANASKFYYRSFNIPKKNGSLREIREPLPNLKEISKWILEEILYKCEVNKFAKGFVPNRSIRENAYFHRKQELVLSLDIENFFGSIKFGRVFRFFQSLGYTDSLAMLFAKLCTLNGELPQGTPTSPALSNLICTHLDRRLSGFALKHKMRYTRYADDITFSGVFTPSKVIWFVKQVLADEKLKLNESKTRIMQRHQQQEVTGIVVNHRLQAPRKVRRDLRQAIYLIEVFGLDSYLSRESKIRANTVQHLMGIANFILFVNPKDRDALHAIEVLRSYSTMSKS